MQPYEKLEVAYADHIGVSHACAVNTGTAALHLALEALELSEDSKVIVPEFTMYASGMAVYYARLTPVFVDCDDNLLINLEHVREHLRGDPKIRVLMVTHVYGRVVNMAEVMSIAEEFDVRVIEDACEAQGAYSGGSHFCTGWFGAKPIGSFDIGCFSFYQNKIIHAEEGGIIVSDDEALIKKAKDMRSMSFGDTHNYYHERIGFNYRCTNSQASMVLESLANVDENLDKRQQICDLYNFYIDEKNQMPNNRAVVWVYDMKHHDANMVVKILKSKGIRARHSFKPMSYQPIFKHATTGKNALRKSEEVFYVHINPDQTVDEIKNNANIINEVLYEI